MPNKLKNDYTELLSDIVGIQTSKDLSVLLKKHKDFFNYYYDLDTGESEGNFSFFLDKPNNSSTIQTNGTGTHGLIELIFNAFDAIADRLKEQISKDELEKIKKESGTYMERFRMLLEHKDTDLSSGDEKLEDQIYIIIAGTTANPCLFVVDKGTGQPNEKIHETFNSIASDNKADQIIQQGTFNIGSTLSKQYTLSTQEGGYSRFKTIITKTAEEDEWSFTVHRKINIYPSPKNASFIYHNAGSDEVMPTINDVDDVLPEVKDIAGIDEHGSIIFLPGYRLANVSVLQQGTSDDLMHHLLPYMPDVPMPFKIVDIRQNKNNKEITYRGEHEFTKRNKDKMFRFKKLNKNIEFPVTKKIDIDRVLKEEMQNIDFSSDRFNFLNPDDLGEIIVTANIFSGETAEDIINQRYCISWTVNGQTHASTHARKFISDENSHYSLLPRRLSIDADFSAVDKGLIETIFNTDRKGIGDNNIAEIVNKEIMKQVNDWKELKLAEDDLQNRFTSGDIKQNNSFFKLINMLKDSGYDDLIGDICKETNSGEMDKNGGEKPDEDNDHEEDDYSDPDEDILRKKQTLRNCVSMKVENFKKKNKQEDIVVNQDFPVNGDFKWKFVHFHIEGDAIEFEPKLDSFEIEGIDAVEGDYATNLFDMNCCPSSNGKRKKRKEPKNNTLLTAYFHASKEVIEALKDTGKKVKYKANVEFHEKNGDGRVKMNVIGDMFFKTKYESPKIIEHSEKQFQEKFKDIYGKYTDRNIFIEYSMPIKIHINRDSELMKKALEPVKMKGFPDNIVKRNYALACYASDKLRRKTINEEYEGAAPDDLTKILGFISDINSITEKMLKQERRTKKKVA